MGKLPRPWRRKSGNGDWYSTLAGRQVWIAPAKMNEAQAEREFRRVLAERAQGKVKKGGFLVRDVVALFLADRRDKSARGVLSPHALEAAVRFLVPLGKALGYVHATELTVGRAEQWVNGHVGWGETTRRSCVTQIQACFNSAVRTGAIPTNPLRLMERPRGKRRVLVPTEAQVRAMIAASGERFADLIRALWWTGCRPNEVYTLTADRVDLGAGLWRVLNKTRGKTGETYRTIHLGPEALALSRRLVAENPDGPVFRNRYGGPWKRKVVVMACHRLQKRLGYGGEASAYGLRHLWATEALAKNVPAAVVAEMMGHRDIAMVTRVYGHLSERQDILKAAAAAVWRQVESDDVTPDPPKPDH